MILCHGEMLIDVIPAEARDGTLAYRPAVGGSPGNVALTLARLEVPTGFVGGLSTDFYGEKIASTLASNGVAMEYVSRLDRPTMLAFVGLSGEEPRYAFYDQESAPRNWRLEEMPPIVERYRDDPGFENAWKGLWAYVEVGDAASACRLAIEADGIGFAPINVVAADTLASEPTDALIRRYCPATELRASIPEFTGAFSIERARRLLGWAPRFAWR